MEHWLSKSSVDGDLNYLYISDDVNNVAMDTPDKVLCMFFIYFEYKVAGFLVAFSHILGFECPFGSCLFFSPTSLHPLLSSSALRMPSPLSYPQNYFPLKGLCLVSWHLHYFQINTHKNWELRSMSEKDRVNLSSGPASPCLIYFHLHLCFIFMDDWVSIVCMCHILSADGHLVWFCFLAAVNRAAENLGVTGFESFGYASGAAQQIYVGILVRVFREAAAPCSTVAVPLDPPPTMTRVHLSPHFHRCSLSLVFLRKTILTWVRWNLRFILFVFLWWIKMLDTFSNFYSPFFLLLRTTCSVHWLIY